MITKFNTAVPAAATPGKSSGGAGIFFGILAFLGIAYLFNEYVLKPKPEEKASAEGDSESQTEEAESTTT